jgi:hypothetical protein
MVDRDVGRAGGFVQQQQDAWNAQWNQHWQQVFLATGDPIRASAYANVMMRPVPGAFPVAGTVQRPGGYVGPQPPGYNPFPQPIPVDYQPRAHVIQPLPPQRPIGRSLFPQTIADVGAYRSPPGTPPVEQWAGPTSPPPAGGLVDFVAQLMRRGRS